MGMVMCSAVVLALAPKERPKQDMDHIASIYRNLGSQAAEQVVARALGELASMMATLAEKIAAHEMADLLRKLRRLDQMADNLGMVTLSVVAQDLSICLERGDATAFSAVWARLMRVADQTLSAGSGLQDQTSV
jgi:HPt (histidine-containing phosphotransfer) domain-containing protein